MYVYVYMYLCMYACKHFADWVKCNNLVKLEDLALAKRGKTRADVILRKAGADSGGGFLKVII